MRVVKAKERVNGFVQQKRQLNKRLMIIVCGRAAFLDP